MSDAAFVNQEKKLKNIVYSLSRVFGTATESRLAWLGRSPESRPVSWTESARRDASSDPAAHEKPWEVGFIHAQGLRMVESGLRLIAGWAFSAPYGDLKLKGT